MRRAFWTLLSPFVWIAHRLGLCSYKWVNVCHGARHRDRFDALWQCEWYGSPIEALPESVTLCGIGYRTAVSEGTVTFIEDYSRNRITFERDPHEALSDLWYLTLSEHAGVPASHIRAAYAWVCAVFGGSFERRALPLASPDPLEVQ
jgi:hypothetical protein